MDTREGHYFQPCALSSPSWIRGKATIFSHALSRRRDGFLSSIMNTAKMNKKTTHARPAPKFLLVNKKCHRGGKQVWLTTKLCHI